MIQSALLFGDNLGIPLLVKHLPREVICGLVGAEIRPAQHSTLQSLAKTLQVSLFVQPRHTSPDYPAFVETLRQLAPELIIANSYSMLLHPDILAIPPCGAINIHSALLPQYRGSNPIQWALLNNETETGVTMHYMSAEFDSGDIIAQRVVPIYFEDTWLEIQARLASSVDAMLAEEIPKLLSQSHARIPQNKTLARYYRRRHLEDGLFNWENSVLYIYNLIRALVKPHPGAFYEAATDRMVLDEYLTIPQITALKYGTTGRRILQGSHVALRSLNRDDLPRLSFLLDSLIRGRWKVSCIPTVEHAEAWLKDLQEYNDQVVFGICSLPDGSLIGACQVHNIDYMNRGAELQARLDPQLNVSQVYIEEVIQLLARFSFSDLELNRVYVHALSNDSAMLEACRKVGFVEEGRLRQAARVDPDYLDIVVMGLLRFEVVSR